MKLTKSATTVLLAAFVATCAVNGCNTNSGDQQQAEEQRLGVNQAALSPNCSTGPNCSTDATDSGLVTSVTAEVGCGQFPFILQRTSTSDLTTGAFTVVESITRQGDAILTTRVHSSGSNVDVTVDYGAGFQGIQHAHFASNGQIITGEIDGRSIVPMPAGADPNTATFQDGQPAPKVKVNQNTESAIAQLRENADTAPPTCFEAPEVLQTSEVEASASVSDNGHVSNTKNTLGCTTCLGACYASGATCVLAAVKLCTLTGPFYGLCMLTASFICSGVAIGCFVLCNDPPGQCCPVGCGDSACCLSGEECLNSTTGLCCSPDQTRCLNKSCCGEMDACIETGPIAGTCCPATQTCGQNCCDVLEQCANTATGLCCSPGQTACNGQCCNFGDACIDNQCCPPAQACGGTCCNVGDQCTDPVNGVCASCGAGLTGCDPNESDGPDICCPAGVECGYSQGVPTCCAPTEVFCKGECRISILLCTL